jgi:hypothetical protein
MNSNFNDFDGDALLKEYWLISAKVLSAINKFSVFRKKVDAMKTNNAYPYGSSEFRSFELMQQKLEQHVDYLEKQIASDSKRKPLCVEVYGYKTMNKENAQTVIYAKFDDGKFIFEKNGRDSIFFHDVPIDWINGYKASMCSGDIKYHMSLDEMAEHGFVIGKPLNPLK